MKQYKNVSLTTSCASSCSTIVYIFSFCITTYVSVPTSDYVLLTSSSTNLLCGSTSNDCIYRCFSFVAKVVFICTCFFILIHLWFFIFLSSSLEYLWFLNLHVLFLSCPTRPCFILLILVQCLCAY